MNHDTGAPATLAEILPAKAAQCPEATALWWREEAISYAALHRRARKAAIGLAASGAPGDRIAILAWNSPGFVELIYAAAFAAQTLVPLNARLAPEEWLDQLRRTGCRRVFGEPALLQSLTAHPAWREDLTAVPLDRALRDWQSSSERAPLPTAQPGDTAWILFTSGSTGRPKGAMLSHAALLAGLRSAALARPVQSGDRYFYPFPLFHIAAHNVILQHRHGAAVVLARSFNALETLQACRHLGITTMSLAPTMISMLLAHPSFTPADFDAVRTIGYGASAMPEGLLRQLLDETSVGLCQSYGMTELCGSVAFLTAEDHRAAINEPHLLRSVGKPLATADIEVVAADGTPRPTGKRGEIRVRAAQCMSGYWDDAEATGGALRDRWLYTGDIGLFDADGYLYIVDRKKDMIISGGENIASREVEEAMRRHPDVGDCAVIGLPDERWGETVCAAVVLRRATADDTLAAHCRSLLAGYKTPRRWFRLDELPLNAAGKVDKPALRRRFASAGAAAPSVGPGH